MTQHSGSNGISELRAIRLAAPLNDHNGDRAGSSIVHDGHRAWYRIAVVLATTVTGAFLLGDVRPAHAATSVQLLTSASMSTEVGNGIFANVNLMGTTVAPTGTVTFRLHGPSDTTCLSPIFTVTAMVTGVSVNSSNFVTTQAGTHRWTTSYSGDANYYAAEATPCASEAADVSITKARTVIRVTALAPQNGRLIGSGALTGGYLPTGTISYFLSGPGDTFCSSPLFTSTVTVNGNGTYQSSGYAPTVSGTYRWRASYNGDANNKAVSLTSCMTSTAAVSFTV